MILVSILFGTSILRLNAGDVSSQPAERNPDALIVSGGVGGIFDQRQKMVYAVEYRFGAAWHNVHPWIGVFGATDGALFAGCGAVWSFDSKSRRLPLHVAVGFAPGYYNRDDGPNLGAHLEFMSYVELGYILRSRQVISLRLSHVSNGGISNINPGVESLTLGFTIPFR